MSRLMRACALFVAITTVSSATYTSAAIALSG